MKIAVIGLGYVGMANAVMLARNNQVVAVDQMADKVNQLNKKISPIKEKEIEKALKTEKLNISATCNCKEAIKEANYIIISTSTNYDEQTNMLDVSSVETVIAQSVALNKTGLIIIRSTVPIGFTRKMQEKFNSKRILFLPEFLREGNSLHDNLCPDRIIIGGIYDDVEIKKAIHVFVNLLLAESEKRVPVLFMNSTEAEAVKLFANAYLALRVAFFNELDTYAEIKELNVKDIIEGVSLDKRIGQDYNNPSFGYGGYCLSKDTKQLMREYHNIPNSIIMSIVTANEIRKRYIVTELNRKIEKAFRQGIATVKIGIYRLEMKKNGSNYRNSAVLDIIKYLDNNNVEIIIYEPLVKENYWKKYKVIKNIEELKRSTHIIIANRYSSELRDVKKKIYTRDVFSRD